MAMKATKTAKGNKISIKAATKDRLPMCWLYSEGNYILTAKGGKAIERKLPYVDVKYVDALRQAGIGCNITKIPNKYNAEKEYEVCEYYNTEVYEMEKLPVYTKMQGSEEVYVFTGEVSAHDAVTVQTIKKAYELKNAVRYICAKQDLGGKMGMVKFINVDKREINLLGEDGGRIKMLQAYSIKTKEDGTEVELPTKFYGVFDMEQVETNHFIQVVAEEGKAKGTAIGKKGRNRTAWEDILGGGRKIIFV